MTAARTRRYRAARTRRDARTDAWFASRMEVLREVMHENIVRDTLLAEARALTSWVC
jgi:hypothetical protein